jgi:hypothetical protein
MEGTHVVELNANVLRKMQIFYPYALGRHQAVSLKGTRFVHYTRAEAAVNILSTKRVWMRKSTCMNDFMEVQHGLNCLVAAYHDEPGKRLKAHLDSLFPGLSGEFEQLFNGWAPHFHIDSYFSCFSEHHDEEDKHGRLSMWRAYGADSGVAMVMNNGPFLRPSDALRAYTSPVAYLDDTQFRCEFSRIPDNMARENEFLRSLGREELKNTIFAAFRFAAVCTKHPGFAEEQEWRVVHCPAYDRSEHLEKSVEVINGVPQPVYKIPLQNFPKMNLYGAAIPELIDRIIIGPTQYPLAICEAFVELLTKAGDPNAAKKVFYSNIPLRR